MFQHRIQRRRWAAFALLMWLCALGIQVAHACVSPQPLVMAGSFGQGASKAAAQALHDDTAVAVASHCGGTDAAAPVDTGPPAQANCADFCDKASASLPPLKSALEEAQLHALLLPALAPAFTLPAPPPAADARLPGAADGAPAAPPIPIPIAFLRLAL